MRHWTENRLLVTFAIVSGAAMGLLAIVIGDGSEKVLGLAFLVMMGGAGAAWWIGEFRTRRAAEPRLGTLLLHSGLTSPALLLPSRRGKERAALIAQAAIAAGGLMLAAFPDALGSRGGPFTQLLFVVIGIFLGLNVLRGLFRWTDRDSYLALTPTGLLARASGVSTYIPWNEISRMSTLSIYGQPYLGIDVTEPHVIETRGRMGFLDRFERPLVGRDRSIWLGGFALPAEKMERLIRGYFDHPETRPRLGREPLEAGLLNETERRSPAVTELEKRHARSLGRWVGAAVLFVYGIYVSAIPIVVAARFLSEATERPAAPSSPGQIIAALVVGALLVFVLLIGLAHFAAAVGIVMRNERARRVGIGLSAIGAAIGGAVVAAVILTGHAGDPGALVVATLLVAGYSISLVTLVVVGSLTLLQSRRTAPRGSRPKEI